MLKLQIIAKHQLKISQKNLNVILVTSEKFTNDLINSIKNRSTSEFKNILTDSVLENIEPISKKIKQLLNNKDYIKNILKNGKDKANEIANNNLKEIKKIVGLLNI